MELIEKVAESMAVSPSLRVLFADDFAPFRQTLASQLPSTVTLVGEASTGKQAVEQARLLRPDLIFMDYRMPEMDGVSAATAILETDPGIAIFLTSLSFERQYVLRALAAGVRGYLSKGDAPTSLDAVIDAVGTRQPYLSSSVAAMIQRTAPAKLVQASQEVLSTFDREAPALLECARRIAHPDVAQAALMTAIRAYWMTLRESEPIADPQTWLLLSLAALLFPIAKAAPARWSFLREHPGDRELRGASPRLLGHVSACRACFLARTLATYDPQAAADVTESRTTLIRDLNLCDEPILFLAFAQRQAAVMRMAASELQVLLGSEAGRGWTNREASAGSWLGAFLGGKPRAEAGA